ncbi:MAG TPA: aldose epimerase family protein, partial [Streptosporangiaceae bacterium]|nr:aldose epimerase family protein [Streptosporangiaceae bacterium]
MREIGRQHRLRRLAFIGLAALMAIGVGGALAATQANAASIKPAAQTGPGGGLSLSRQFFGQTVEPYTGKETNVYRYTLRNARGMSVQILTYGGIVQDIWMPGRNGRAADVVLGFKTLQDYVNFASPPVTANGGPYFGEIIGRYGNRIAKGTFSLTQPGVGRVTYTLPINNGVNSLHGGLVGFGNHIWADQPIRHRTEVGVQLTLVSPNGDQAAAAGSPGCPNGCTGYPATIKVVVTYTLNNANQLAIHYKTTDLSSNLNTVINLTNHSYFNLAGEGSGSAANQLIKINANSYTPTDSTQIPTGQIAPVAGTPFDFTHLRTIASGIEDCTQPTSQACQQLLIAQGYDHNWVLNKQTAATTGPDGLNLAARALDPASGRELSVWTDQPGVQFYTSNFLNGTL